MSKQKIIVLVLFGLAVVIEMAITKSPRAMLEGKSPVQVFFAAWLWCMFYNGIK